MWPFKKKVEVRLLTPNQMLVHETLCRLIDKGILSWDVIEAAKQELADEYNARALNMGKV